MSNIELNLVSRSLNAVKWNYAGTLLKVASQLIAQISLARLLGPEVFGIFAIALLIIGLGGLIVEMGLGAALIQTREIDDEDIRVVHTRIVLTGLLMAGAVGLLSGIPATFFGEKEVGPVLTWLAPALVLRSLAIVPLALLKRNLDLKAVQITQLISYVCGYVVIGIGSAILGAGIWSLVAAVMVTNLAAFIMAYSKTRHTLAPKLRGNHGRLTSFGAKVALTNISNWFIENVDNLIAGKVFGAGFLGLYSVSYNIVRSPTNHLVSALQTVLFPASARAQDNTDMLRRGYLIVVSAVILIALPVFTGVAAVSDTVIHALFGNRWAGASPILLPLALAMIFHAIMAIAGPMLLGIGRAGTELKVQTSMAATLFGVLLFASRFSPTALAWGVFSVYGLRAAWITSCLLRQIDISLASFWRAVRGAVLLASVVLTTLLGEDYLLRNAGQTASYRLGAEVLSAGFVWLAIVFAAPKLVISSDLAWALQRIVQEIPLLEQSIFMRRLQGTHRNIAG